MEGHDPHGLVFSRGLSRPVLYANDSNEQNAAQCFKALYNEIAALK
jgi:hypothetical protein